MGRLSRRHNYLKPKDPFQKNRKILKEDAKLDHQDYIGSDRKLQKALSLILFGIFLFLCFYYLYIWF